MPFYTQINASFMPAVKMTGLIGKQKPLAVSGCALSGQIAIYGVHFLHN
jgi:hypothetical protein